MAVGLGIRKELRIKKETTWGTLAGASGAQLLRRKTSDLDESRDTFMSDEINPNQQVGSYTHGSRKAEGSIDGELSGGTYAMLMQSLLRRDFTAVTPITALSLTFAGTGPTYTIARAAGSWLTDGAKEGMVVRVTAGAVNANNLNKNFFIVTAVALTLTVIPWGNGTATAEGPIASCTVSVPGKVTFTPATGQTNDSYTVEHYYTDLVQSEVMTGCRPSTADINLPSTGNAGVTFAMLGKGMPQVQSSAYFTSPTAATTSSVMTAVNGILRAVATTQTVLTAVSIKVDGNMTTQPVVGSNYTPDVFQGRLEVTGQITALFDSVTMRDAFLQESVVALQLVMFAGTAAAAEFVAFACPSVKFGSAKKSDGQGPITLTVPFQAIFNAAGGTGTASEATSLWVQDSLAP
jgi:hypothetical protein